MSNEESKEQDKDQAKEQVKAPAVYVPPKKKKQSIFSRAIGSSINVKERINFARHLAVSIRSGLPLLEGLRLIQGQAASKNLTRIINQIIADVDNGQSLANSLAGFGDTFGSLFINMVKVGEASGRLSENLMTVSLELKKQHEISSKIKSAFVYPSVILVATVGMTIFLTTVIFPKILPIFTSLKVQLPATTKAVIFFLSFINSYGLYVLVGLVVFGVFFRIFLTFRAVRFFFNHLVLYVPVVSTLIINLTLATFTRSLGTLLKSGMTIVDALGITKGTIRNLYYQHHIDNLIDTVRRGENMARYLKTQPKIFPPMFSGMINVGEGTGNLEGNLENLSDYYTEEVGYTIQNLTNLLEPVLILVMGLVVGFIALSIITPIYSITQGLQVK